MKNSVKIKPFLRWAGGKNWLAKSIDDYLPPNISNYYEPFLGGGSIFIKLKQIDKIENRSYLGDLNPGLINAYKVIKKYPHQLISILDTHVNSKEEYYKMRSLKPLNDLDKAARFIYLNRNSFNGIYRENLKGEYNVPYGYKKYKELYDFENILSLSKKFKNCFFSVGQFNRIRNNVSNGDLIFLDPPYTVAHSNNGFVKYNQKIFSWKDQIKLRDFIMDLHIREIYFILTNAYHISIRDLYSGFSTLHELERPSLVGGTNANRQTYKEYLITNII